jgi:flagellar hook protein FlgE
MADADLKAKEKAAEAAKAKADQANIEAELAKAEAEAAKAKADQEAKEKAAEAAKAKAEEAKTKAEEADNEAARAKAEADQAKGKADQETKEKAAEVAKAKAEQANTEAEQAKTKAEEADNEADRAKAEADRAKAKAEQAKTKAEEADTEAAVAKAEVKATETKSWYELWYERASLTRIILLLLAVLGLVAIICFISRETLLNTLKYPEVVRGLITLVISLITVFIAVILVIGALTLKEDGASLKERFDMANRVLTALIGILGTIVGFYFGSAVAPPTVVQGLKVADIKVEGEPKPDETIKLSFQVTGGKAPYSYTVTFPAPTTIAPLKGKTQNGKVSAEITVPANIKPNTELTPIKIEVTDSDKETATQEMKEPKIPIKAKDGAQPKT